jgi:hypothetical protein
MSVEAARSTWRHDAPSSEGLLASVPDSEATLVEEDEVEEVSG